MDKVECVKCGKQLEGDEIWYSKSIEGELCKNCFDLIKEGEETQNEKQKSIDELQLIELIKIRKDIHFIYLVVLFIVIINIILFLILIFGGLTLL